MGHIIMNSYFQWCQKNLFSSKFNTLITMLSLLLFIKIIPPMIDWLIFSASFLGESNESCTQGGACWLFIKQRFFQFIYGFYPENSYWRINSAGILVMVAIIQFYYKKWSLLTRFCIAAILFVSAFILLYGGLFGLKIISTSRWGGLSLTLILAISSIICSFPIALLLALGKHSSLIFIKSFSCNCL